MAPLTLQLGVKTDPAQYRFSYDWLFRLLAEEGIRYVQLGTFFEMYQLPDEYFQRLRRQAEQVGIRIHSVFTAHRELGGFFIDEPGWERVARRNYERLIEVGALLGAQSVGSNPGAVYRDQMQTKPRGLNCYLGHMKELLGYAHERGVAWLTVEPMSCLAEPPALPDEIRRLAEELAAWHDAHPHSSARIGYCADIAHGYADRNLKLRYDHLQLLEAALPYLVEMHLKNTDARYSSTFGFGPEERAAGIVRIEPVRELLQSRADIIPVDLLVGYLEIGGPKLGRDYSDPNLANQLRASLQYLKDAWTADSALPGAGRDSAEPARAAGPVAKPQRPVKVSPSLMCADLGRLEDAVRQLEAAGADLLHIDMADGHFAPNLLLGLDVVRWLRPKTALPLDVHLMVENPDVYVDPLAQMGVEMIAVHAEACRHLDRTLKQIRDHGAQAGVALKPATPLTELQQVIEQLGFVLLLMVNPGFAGQKLVGPGIQKIAECRKFLESFGRRVPIMVDGNVSFEHIPQMIAAGADILVAGTSSWFNKASSLAANARKTEEAIAAGLKIRTEFRAS